MNRKARLFVRNVVYAVGANMSQILTTLVLTLLLPKVMTVESYGYWQLYHFYATYLMYSSLGWCEGLYIKYGGTDYEKLDRRLMSSQVIGIALHELIFGILVLAAWILGKGTGSIKGFLLAGSVLYMILRVIRFQLQTILQAVSRISEYAKVYSGERILFLATAFGCILWGKYHFSVFICAELFSNAVLLLYAIYLCREIIFTLPCSAREMFREEKELIRGGWSISMASFLGQMMIGVVRFAIEQRYGTVVFGKISLSFSMANMLVTCITAVSIVIFPALKRLNREKANQLYIPLRELMTIPMFGVLLIYVPMSCALCLWLPQYGESIKYLAVLLPMCIYEVRNSVLACTYLKVWDGQKYILYTNLCALAVSVIVTFLTIYVIGSVDLAVASIMGLYAFKTILTEHMVKKYISIKTGIFTVQELLLTAVFMVLCWSCTPFVAFAGYLACYCLYLLIEKERLVNAWRIMKGMVKN